MITSVKFAKEWHFGMSSYPQDNSDIYMLVEEDCFTLSEPLLLDGKFRFVNDKPEFCIVQEDGSLDNWTLLGGHSIYAWRYKRQVIKDWSGQLYEA